MVQNVLKINGIPITPVIRSIQPLPTGEELKKLLESFPDPVKMLLNLPASRAQWSPQLEKTFSILKEYFPKQTGVAHIQLFMQVVRNAPELLEPLTSLLSGFREQKIPPRTAEAFLELVGRMVRDLGEPTPDLHAQSLPQSARLNLEKREMIQALAHLRQLVTRQTGSLPVKQRALEQMAEFLTYAYQEHPDTFSQELFAAPVLLEAGLDLLAYQAAANEAEPLRLAVLAIAAKQQGTAVLARLIADIRTAGRDGGSILPTVQKWEEQLKPGVIPSSVRPNVVSPAEGFVSFKEGVRQALYLCALDPQEGVLPAQSWQMTPDFGTLALQGSLLMLGVYPLGFNRLKLQVKNKKKAAASLEFLFFILRGGEEEPVEAAPENEKPKPPNPYESENILPSLTSPLSGSIELAVNGPYILLSGYDPDKTIPAPLQVSFKFLADVVDPKTLHSRKNFLTLDQSSEAKTFREAVRRLSKEGIKAYQGYLDCLNGLFARLEGALPVGAKSLEAAKNYLRDQVMLYLMGQKRQAVGQPNQPQLLKAVEASPRGDVMASICSTVAGACAAGGQVGEALIHFSDAAELAATKPYFFYRLQKFFGDVKAAFGNPGGNTGYWKGDLPVLPPGPFDSSSATPQSTALARTFIANLKIQ